MRRRTVILSATGITAALAGCSGGSEDEESENLDLPNEATVEIVDGAFDPMTVHVATGGTVTWENTGEEPHEIAWDQFQAGSSSWQFEESLEPGDSVTHTFESEGRYDFIDSQAGRFDMCGRIRVGGADEGDSLPCE